MLAIAFTLSKLYLEAALTNHSGLRTEYLVIVEQDNSVGTTVDGIYHLLNAHESIFLEKGRLRYEGSWFTFSITSGKVAASGDPFFHLTFECADENDIESFAKALTAVRKVMGRFTPMPAQTLWDGIGFHYANLSYPLIHRIENLMRMLLTKFMFITIGIGWTKTNVPEEVRKSIRDGGTVGEHNYLFSSDFIQLANFLFKPYASAGQEELIRSVEDAIKQGSTIKISNLEKYIPKSNWTRYFETIVDCDADYLEKRWGKLYDLRCKIAHNNIINRADYEKVARLVSELEDKLETAIAEISKVEVSAEEREAIAEDVAGLHTAYGEFITQWKQLERLVRWIAADVLGSEGYTAKSAEARSLRAMIKVMVRHEYISKDLQEKFDRLRHLRNTIVHEPYIRLSSTEIENAIREMADVAIKVEEQVHEAFFARAKYKKVDSEDNEEDR